MRTGTVENRITTQAHAAKAIISNQLNQVVFEYRQLTNWSRAFNGALAQCYDVAVCTNADGEIVRVRTLAAGTLQISYAVPADSLTWTNLVAANFYGTALPTATASSGVAVISSGNNVDVVFCNGTTIYRIRSTDKGHTFPSAAETVKALGTQQASALIRVAQPAVGIVFFTDSPLAWDTATSGAGTRLCYNIYSGAAWGTSVTWDLDLQPLGMNLGVSMPDTTSQFSTLAATAITTDGAMTNDYLLAFYAAGLRGDAEYGLFTLRVKNVAAGLTAQWCNPQKMWATAMQQNLLAGATSQPSIFVFAPKLQVINGQYWMTATEVSNSAGTILYDLRYSRSADGVVWEGRQYLCGTEAGWTHLVTATPTAWTLTDFLFGQVVVSVNRTFVVGYDRAYVAASTSLVGITNTSKRFDATVAAKQDSLDLPENGDAGMYTLHIKPDAAGVVDAQVGATIREGAEITVNAGYCTGDQGSGNAAGEQIQIAQLIVDQVPEDFTRNIAGRDIPTITARDYTKKLTNWKSDLWYSYSSGRRYIASSFSDSSAFIALNGTFIPVHGQLGSGPIDANYSTIRDNSMIMPYQMKDGELMVRVRNDGAAGAWTNGSTAGILFGVVDGNNYFALLHDYIGFAVWQAKPATGGRTTYTETCLNPGAPGSGVALDNNTDYWFYAKQIHNRVLLWYSTDKLNWTKVVDYTGTAAIPIPTVASYWGIVAKGAVSASAPIGNQTKDGHSIWIVNPTDGITRRDIACRVLSPAGGGYLRAISFNGSWGGLNTPDLAIGLLADDGTTNHPANIVADPTKIVYQTTITRTMFGNAYRPTYTCAISESVLLAPNTYYHIWLHPVSNSPTAWTGWDLSGAQGSIATTYPASQSDDAGQTWVYANEVNSFSGYATIGVDAVSSGVSFSQIQLAEDAIPQSFERITADLVAKAGVMTTAFTNVVSDNFVAALDTGADATNHMWANNQNGTWATSGDVLTGYNSSAGVRTYLRSNSYRGAIGDGILKCQLNILAANMYAGLILRGGGSPTNGTSQGYSIYLGTGTGAGGIDQVIFSLDSNNAQGIASGAVLTAAITGTGVATFACTTGILRVSEIVRIDNELFSVTAIAKGVTDTVTVTRGSFGSTAATHLISAPIYACILYCLPCPMKINPGQFVDVTILNQAGWYQVFVNEMLVGSFFDQYLTTDGSVGFFCIGNNAGGAVAQWDNIQFSDLSTARDSFVVQPGTDARAAIQNLIGQDRIYVSVRYDGALVATRSNLRASADTYSTTARKIRKVLSDEDWFNEVMSSNSNIATMRRDGTQMERGVRTRFFSFPDVQNDAEGYAEAAVPIRAGKEKSVHWEVEHAPVWTADREDCVTLSNQDSGVSNIVIIKSLRWARDFETKLASGTIVLNQFVS